MRLAVIADLLSLTMERIYGRESRHDGLGLDQFSAGFDATLFFHFDIPLTSDNSITYYVIGVKG